MDVRRRRARIGATLAAAPCAILIPLANDDPAAVVIFAPALAGALLAAAMPDGPAALWAAAALVLITATLGLIGYWGLLFLPSVVLLLVAASRPSRAETEVRSPRP